MGVWEFIFSEILRREYPLIRIKKGVKGVPYYTNCPDSISLFLDKRFYPLFGLKTQKDFEKFYIAVLEHEYIHYILCKHLSAKTSVRFDRINSWSIEKRTTTWGLHKRLDIESMITEQTNKAVRVFFTGLSVIALVFDILAASQETFIPLKMFWYFLGFLCAMMFWRNIKQLKKG